MMKDHSALELNEPSSMVGTEQSSSVHPTPREPAYLFHSLLQWFITDWRTRKYFFFGALLLLINVSVTVAYYVNYPGVTFDADTPAYLVVAERLYTHPYLLVDAWRLPGYPLLIAFVYAFAGYRNWMAVSAAQDVLFVLATMEIYVLAILVFKRTWMAFLIGLIVGTNVILISYVKPIMSEGMALWLLTTLTLALVYYVHTLRLHAFWLVVVCLVLLVFTRPEWLYLPVPLFAFVLLVAVRRGVRWRSGLVVLLNIVVALTCIYTLVGIYIYINTRQNNYPGLTAVENFNLMGKVLQYNMQDEAPPQYAQISHQLDILVVKDRDPYHILPYVPALAKDYSLPAGTMARAIILHHPVEFLVKSLPLFPPSLTSYYDSIRPNIHGPFDEPLALMKSFDRILYQANVFFLLCIPLWLVLFCGRRLRTQQLPLERGSIFLGARLLWRRGPAAWRTRRNSQEFNKNF
ncbi:MAG: hypothetical protein E6J11_18270 [Chloroflexi bacterium]|nr:MAG: hypothetical protein E6J11_18270 [Chloroflexota bacterium]